jgi:molybdate transport system permease protein
VRRPPPVVIAVAAVAAALFALPLAGLLWRAPWTGLWQHLTTPEAVAALRVSMVTSVTAAAVSVLLGLPLAWLLARAEFPLKALVRAVVILPLVLPPVVGGIALLFALGRRGLVGQYLERWFGIGLPFTTAGAVIAATFVAMPFFVLALEAGFRGVDHRLEEAARTLRAGRWTVFRRVTLPLLGPSLAAGVVLAWARALGEFGATITFAGNFPGRTQTLPLAAYLALESDPGEAIALSLVLLVVSGAVLVGLRGRWLGMR